MSPIERELPINLPELASGRGAWRAFLARLDDAPEPDRGAWVKARASAVDMLAWFEAHPEVVPPGEREAPAAA